ncbi:MAG: hypothetical protein KAS23_01785 [Anaerohalosphaera sp.]|nr:hypothetical protein [Anaerohalosphaera sp.]
MDKQTEIRIDELVFKSFEGVISEQECRELEAMIESSSIAREYYCSCIYFNLGMLKVKDVVHQPLQMQMLLEEMAEYEKKAPTIHIEKPIEKSVESWQGLMKVEKPKRTISRLSVYTLILSAAAVLFLMILVLSSPIRPIVATLTDSINAEWISEDEIPAKGEVLREGALTLVRGFAEITFDDGAVVIVEAPAVIELESSKSMFVHSGKISAVISEYAIGFTVNILSGSIVDLGTEFGVSVEGDGSCSLYMFEGKANLIAGQEGQKRTSQIVTEGQARQMKNDGRGIRSIGFNKHAFVRQIPSPYELAVKQIPSPYELAVRKTKPVYYWRFSRKETKRLINKMDPYGRTGKFVGDVKLDEKGPGLGGEAANDALWLSGVDGGVLIPDEVARQRHTDSYSIALWVRPDFIQNQNIIANTDRIQGPDVNFSRQLRMTGDGYFEHYTFREPDHQSSLYNNPLEIASRIKGTTLIESGQWYHVVITAEKEGIMRLFVNGREDAESLKTEFTKEYYNQISIGQQSGTDHGQVNNRMKAFVGAIDEISYYDRVITEKEISDLFRSVEEKIE